MQSSKLTISISLLVSALMFASVTMSAPADRQWTQAGAEYPNISSDGKTVVFTRMVQKQDTLFTINLETGVEKTLGTGSEPEFSPSGDRICFIRSDCLNVLSLKDGKTTALTEDTWNGSPHWNGDGSKIYYLAVREKKLWVCALDMSTRKMTPISSRNEIEASPSPDGRRLAFTISEANGARSVGIMDIDGANPRIIWKGEQASGGYFNPRWSPDSQWLCMVSSQLQPVNDLLAVSIDGKKQVRLTDDHAGNAQPAWSKDGKTIAFARLSGKGLNLFTIPVSMDGGHIEDRLNVLGQAYEPEKAAAPISIPEPAGPDLSAPLDLPPVPGAPESVCLNGEWEAVFNKSGETMPETGWKPLPIPSRFNGYRNYEYSAPVDAKSAPLPTSGWFRVRFTIPDAYRDAPHVELLFECVDGNAVYFMNGRRIGQSAAGEIPVRLRVNEAIRWGAVNEAAVFLQKPAEPAEHQLTGGIRRDVFIRFFPPLYIENTIIRTSVKEKTIESRVFVRNLTRTPAACDISGDVVEEDGTPALTFEPVRLGIPAGAMTEAVLKRSWDNPVLWGFGEYGTPHLYFMKHALTCGGKRSGSAVFRFGFREFRAEGARFMFNGKPFFIKGDIINGPYDWEANRGFAQRYFQFAREGNINFIRHHSSGGMEQLFYSVWLDAADEMGMLLEPQLRLGPAECDEVCGRQWREFIWAHANHPCIAVYSTDNESCSHGFAPRPVMWARQNMRAELVRTLDPERPVEEHGDVALGIAEAMGFYKKLDIWNVHPYGTPLGDNMRLQMLQFQYNGKIPVHVGEMAGAFYESPFNGWTMPAQIIRSRMLQNAYLAAGRKLAGDILSVAGAGAAGASLCAAAGYCTKGPGPDGSLVFGPWTEEAQYYDRLTTDGKFASGKMKANDVWVNKPFVQIIWPSLSGRGRRPSYNPAYDNNRMLINWFDPSRPAYTYNAAMVEIGKSFRDVDGCAPGPLNDVLKPEVVICLAPENMPAAGVFIRVAALGNQPFAPESVMTDPNGTAWFVLPSQGDYLASAIVDGQTFEKRFTAQYGRLPPQEKSGYQHLQFVDLSGNRAAGLRERLLETPARIIITNPRVVKNQFEPQERLTPRTPSLSYTEGPFEPDQDGFIRHWLACGPFPNLGNDRDGYEGFRTDYLTAQGGETNIQPQFEMQHPVVFPENNCWLSGKSVVFWDYFNSAVSRVNLNFLTAPEMGVLNATYVVGYAACYITVEQNTDVTLALGSDDGVKAYLNGRKVMEEPAHGGATPDEHLVPVTLEKGKNLLLLKVDQSLGGWGFYCRFLQDNKPFRDFKLTMK